MPLKDIMSATHLTRITNGFCSTTRNGVSMTKMTFHISKLTYFFMKAFD